MNSKVVDVNMRSVEINDDVSDSTMKPQVSHYDLCHFIRKR